MRKSKFFKILRWSARILGSLVLGFMILFIAGEILMPHAESGPTPAEMLGFVFFPAGVLFGLALSYKYELTGGLISILSYLVFNFYLRWLRDVPIGRMFELFPLLIVSPALLYIILGLALKFSKPKIKNI